MTKNPYSPPETKSSDADRSASASSSRLQWLSVLTIGIAGLAIVAFAFCAFILIPQAIRYQDEAGHMPPALRGQSYMIAQASWIQGATSIIGVVLNLTAIALAFQRRWIFSSVLIAMSVAAFVTVAILYDPT